MDDGTRALLHRNWASVLGRVRAAAARAGRAPEAVTLVAVTKSVDSTAAEALVDLGQTDLGESRVQELASKAAAVRGARWHLVGALQSNKARRALELAELLHGIDDPALLARLDRIASERGRRARCLLEVNVAGEAEKHGVAPGRVAGALEEGRRCAHVDVEGLMTMAPLGAPGPELRRVFGTLRALRDDAARRGLFGGAPRDGGELSMGMSGDFEIAVEEGATYVRVGTALFEGLAESAGTGG
ncbi:MAG TPA: YggS family pyridoxal phosphate-dependent enzyme [Planctomycetota bacterium]|nr:YggS family pyridoxal phosphate-dependent enzyme [Planctomycetota bacterium]